MYNIKYIKLEFLNFVYLIITIMKIEVIKFEE
jgi:hypothetical protein